MSIDNGYRMKGNNDVKTSHYLTKELKESVRSCMPKDESTEQINQDHKHEYMILDPVLTKREYFAGLALQGICVNADRNGFEFENTLQIADKAVELADALIDELEK